MTIFLFSILTSGADKIARLDPHGWTLTIVSISVVFAALFILFLIYALSGEIFSRADDIESMLPTRKSSNGEIEPEVQAAIATAIQLYENEQAHDSESGIITINRPGNWASLSIKRKRL